MTTTRRKPAYDIARDNECWAVALSAEKLVDGNHHVEAMIEVADVARAGRIATALSGLRSLHSFYGEITPSLRTVSEDLRRSLRAHVEAMTSIRPETKVALLKSV